jgi:Na+/alanine symporter
VIHYGVARGPFSNEAFNQMLPVAGGWAVTIGYRIVYIITVFLGCVAGLGIVWKIADILNGLMAFPNLVALLGLSSIVIAKTRHYRHHIKHKSPSSQLEA